MEVTFTVDGLPIAKPRMTQRDRFLPRKCVSQYWAWAEQVRLAARQAMPGQLYDGPSDHPFMLSCNFRFEIPASWSKAKRYRASNERLAHTQRPDLKNLLASIEDALNKIIWRDDSQIVVLGRSTKSWAATSGVTVHLETVTPADVFLSSQKDGPRAPTARVRRVK